MCRLSAGMTVSRATHFGDGFKEEVTVTGEGVAPDEAQRIMDEILHMSEDELHAIFQE